MWPVRLYDTLPKPKTSLLLPKPPKPCHSGTKRPRNTALVKEAPFTSSPRVSPPSPPCKPGGPRKRFLRWPALERRGGAIRFSGLGPGRGAALGIRLFLAVLGRDVARWPIGPRRAVQGKPGRAIPGREKRQGTKLLSGSQTFDLQHVPPKQPPNYVRTMSLIIRSGVSPSR